MMRAEEGGGESARGGGRGRYGAREREKRMRKASCKRVRTGQYGKHQGERKRRKKHVCRDLRVLLQHFSAEEEAVFAPYLRVDVAAEAFLTPSCSESGTGS